MANINKSAVIECDSCDYPLPVEWCLQCYDCGAGPYCEECLKLHEDLFCKDEEE